MYCHRITCLTLGSTSRFGFARVINLFPVFPDGLFTPRQQHVRHPSQITDLDMSVEENKIVVEENKIVVEEDNIVVV